MVSSSIIYTALFTMGFVLVMGSMHAMSVSDSDDSSAMKAFGDDQDDGSLSSAKQQSELHNVHPDEFYSLLMGKRRLPSESILLGKRRLPAESVLLGKRRLPSESILLGKRRLPSESILLGKRRLPSESILLGKRRLPSESILLGKRR